MKGTVITECQALSDCQRNITGHLDMLKMRGDDLPSEKELILLRAGKGIFHHRALFVHGLVFHILGVFEGTVDITFRVCPKHRDSFGIKWRGRKTLPSSQGDRISPVKEAHNRTINKKLSEEIFNMTGSLIPIGSGIHLYYRYFLGMSQ